MSFHVTQLVRFQHCDPAGIVFYPRYFEMINACIEDWFAARLQAPFSRIHGPDAHAVPTARIEIAFTAPSRIDDLLEFELTPLRIGRSSVDLAIAVRCGAEARLNMTSTLVYISQASGRPVSWPDTLRIGIEREIEGDAGHGA